MNSFVITRLYFQIRGLGRMLRLILFLNFIIVAIDKEYLKCSYMSKIIEGAFSTPSNLLAVGLGIWAEHTKSEL